jgi:hypothetical protein
MSSSVLTVKPRKIQVAVYLMWLAVALEIILAFLDYHLHGEDRAWQAAGAALGIGFIVVAACATVFFGRGRNWARTALLVLFLIGLLGLAFTFNFLLSEAAVIGWVSLGELLARGAALYLAYSPPGRSYFRSAPGDDRAMRAILPVGRSGWAIAAGYLAFFSVLLLPAPFALICGVLAMREIRRDPSKHGMGRAVFGVVMGALGVAAILYLAWLRVSR